ncbi:MAG: hypothetical protein AAGG07_01880 [Planctomycetota bacterium]
MTAQAPSQRGPVSLVTDSGPTATLDGGVVVIPQRTPQEAAGAARAQEALTEWRASSAPQPSAIEQAGSVALQAGLWAGGLLGAVALLFVLSAFGARAIRRVKRMPEPSRAAEIALSNRLGLSPQARQTVREVAEAHGTASPVAVLASATAMREGARRLSRKDAKAAARADRLLASLS